MDTAEYRPEILYEDSALLVCVKAPGYLSEPSAEKNLPDLLSARLREAGKPDYIGTVHRLDRDTGGLMVFSKDPKLTGTLINDVAERRMRKEYFAVVRGVPEKSAGFYEDLLFRDAAKNKSYVVQRMRKGVRQAKLCYRVLETVRDGDTDLTLVRVKLFTGRTHQIRVQFASRGTPLLGDIRYGSKDARCGVSLWSCMLGFSHPQNRRDMTFYHKPPDIFPWNLFKSYTAPSPFAVLPETEEKP